MAKNMNRNIPAGLAHLSRKDLARIVDDMRKNLAERASKGDPVAKHALEDLEINYGIKPLVKCDGEAHSNPNIDNCGRCAPRWGWHEPKG